MKKMYKYILVITLMMFGFVGDVEADSKGVNSCVDKGICDLLCQYNYDNGNQYNIYHYYGDNKTKGLYFSFGNGDLDEITSDYKKNSKTAFIDPRSEKELLEKKCPANLYWKKDSYDDKICFDSVSSNEKDKYCQDSVMFSGFTLDHSSPTNKIPDKITNKDKWKNECADNGDCVLVCSYYNYKNSAYIYYVPSEDKFKTSYTWSMYTVGREYDYLYELTKNEYPALIGPTDLENLSNAICPNNVYNDYDGNMSSDICFDNDENYCTKNFNDFNNDKKEYLKLEVNANKEDLEKSKPKDNKMTYEETKEKLEKEFNITPYEICSYSKEGVNNPNVDQFFIVNTGNEFKYFHFYINSNSNIPFKEVNIANLDKIEYNETCMVYSVVYSTNKSGTIVYSVDKDFWEIDTKYPLLWSNGESEDVEYIDIGNIDNCEGLLGKELVDELNSYMLYIKIAVPIIIIVMGSIDFGGAFLASDEDAMKKAQKRFIMRLIIGMVIFFIPTIINVLLDIADLVWEFTGGNGTCGIGF